MLKQAVSLYRSALKLAAMVLVALVLSGCASMKRPTYSVEQINHAAAHSLGGIRYLANNPYPIPIHDSDGAQDVLALSGGGPDGAYGAGLLSGWKNRGDLPEFDIVTGVSTGALMAPFAFLGGEEIDKLASLYVGLDVTLILSQGSPLRLISGPSVYKQKRLRQMIERNITADTLDRIAAQHLQGRRLLIATANLDAQEMVVWDMGAIASRGTSQSLSLFRNILLASTSVPIAFDPIGITVPEVGAEELLETHSDATLFSLFYFHPSLFDADRCQSETKHCTLYIIAHNKTLPDPKTIKWSAPGIGARAIETMVKAGLAAKLELAKYDADQVGAQFRFAYLDVPFEGVSAIDFDLEYMRKIFAIGQERGAAGIGWLDQPPRGIN